MKLRTKKVEIWIEETVGEETAKFLVSPATPKDDFDLIEQSKTKEWDRNQRFENTDFYKFKMTKIVNTIKDWSGIEDEKGNDLECNRYNKELVYLHNPDLIDRVLAKAEKLGQKMEEEKKEKEKNSDAGQSGPAAREK